MTTKSIHLPNFRSTSSFILPSGWAEGEQTRGRFSLAQVFHHQDNIDLTITVFARGHELSPAMADRFKIVLSEKPHALDELERQRISEVLAEQAMRNRFALTAARTEIWNGKKLLITEGAFCASGDRAFSLFVDANDDGQWVEEFQYCAPANLYEAHLPAVSESLKNIVWNFSAL